MGYCTLKKFRHHPIVVFWVLTQMNFVGLSQHFRGNTASIFRAEINSLNPYDVCNMFSQTSLSTYTTMSKPVHYIRTPPRKPAKLCSQVFHSLMWLYCFNQSQCLDISNIFLYPYLSISAKNQCLYIYNY